MTLSCVICQEDLCNDEANYPVNIKQCGHVFHKKCLEGWLMKSGTCPVCRIRTFNLPDYIGKLHFQRISYDGNSSREIVSRIIDENSELRAELNKVKDELERNEKLWKKKEEAFKKIEDAFKRKEKETGEFLKSINEETSKIVEIRNKISAYTKALLPTIVDISHPSPAKRPQLKTPGASSSTASRSTMLRTSSVAANPLPVVSAAPRPSMNANMSMVSRISSAVVRARPDTKPIGPLRTRTYLRQASSTATTSSAAAAANATGRHRP